MRKMRVFIQRIRGFFLRRRLEKDLQDEIRSHLEMQIDENLRHGMSAKEARQAALRKFGGVDQVKERYRERRGLPAVETFVADLRYSCRILVQKPAFTILATIALALGIGTNTAIFSVVNSVLLRPLPYSQPDRLVMIWNSSAGRIEPSPMSPARYLDLRSRNQVLADVAAYEDCYISNRPNFAFSGGDHPEQIWGARASGNLFSVLGAKPKLGRTFSEADENSRVVVLGEGLWRRDFGASPDVLGRTVTLSGTDYTVIGVMPSEFKLVYPKPAELWVPMPFTAKDRTNRNEIAFWTIGRIKTGLNISQARAGLSSLSEQLGREYPIIDSRLTFDLVSLDEYVKGNTRSVFLILMAAVSLVLIIACANVSGLLLARTTERTREIALRTALGATRFRLGRQLLTESLVLSLLGGAAGLLFAAWSLRVFSSLIPATVPRGDEIRIDTNVLVFALAGSALTGLVFGLIPAFWAMRFNLNELLKDGGAGTTAGSTTRRIRGLLMISEIALTMILLTGAGLLVNSQWRLSQLPLGFKSENILTLGLRIQSARYRDQKGWADFDRQIVERVSGLPGVIRAGTSSSVLMHGIDSTIWFKLTAGSESDKEYSSKFRMVGGDFFETMGINILHGTSFPKNDLKDSPQVVIINEAFAHVFFPDQDPIGKRLHFSDGGVPIIGIINDVRDQNLRESPRPAMYFSQDQLPYGRRFVVVHTAGDPSALTDAVRKEIWSIDKDQPIEFTGTMSQIVSDASAETHFYLAMLGAFAMVALVLTSIGVYGVTSYAVTQRTREIGIRMALGAQSTDVISVVIARGVVLTIVGVVAGLLGSFGLTRLMKGLLFGVTATDPLTFVAVAVAILLIGFLACYLPARRATKVDPMTALRCE